jgi:hypothetical protein
MNENLEEKTFDPALKVLQLQLESRGLETKMATWEFGERPDDQN